MFQRIFGLIAVAIAATPLAAEAPEFYKTVDRVVWVVEDAGETMGRLREIGFTNLSDLGEVELEGRTFRGQPATGSVRLVSGRFGDVAVHWIEPHEGANAYAEFLKKHRSGVFGLVYRTPTAQAFRAEVERMKAAGVGVLMEGSIEASGGTIRWAFFDTEREGKYALGIVHFPNGEGPLAISPANPSGRVVRQYAFAVRKLEPVSEYWAKLGFPPMQFTHGKRHDMSYRGRPADFDMRLGWQRQGTVPFEWIQSLQGPDVYLDHMKVHGEGLHHLAFRVDNMDEDVAWWAEKGYPASMSGGWGEKGKPGSGRFTYIDAQPIGGTDIELLWSFKK